jgi:hypothetical protein
MPVESFAKRPSAVFDAQTGPNGKPFRKRLSYCIPVMNRQSDLQSTLDVTLAQHSNLADQVEFVVISYDSDTRLIDWLHSRFADHIAGGLLRAVQAQPLDMWHFGRAKNGFSALELGQMVSSLDADNFVTVEETTQILDIAAQTGGHAMIHHWRGLHGDGTSGRLTMPSAVYRQTGYDERLFARQFDEMAAILRGLCAFADLPLYSYGGDCDIFAVPGAMTDFFEKESLPNPRRILPQPQHIPPINQRGETYVGDDAMLQWGGIFNAAQMRFGLAMRNDHREEMRQKAIWAARKLVQTVPAAELAEALFLGPLPPRFDGSVIYTVLQGPPEFLPRFFKHHLELGAADICCILPPDVAEPPDLPPRVHLLRARIGNSATMATLWVEVAHRCLTAPDGFSVFLEPTQLIELPPSTASLGDIFTQLQRFDVKRLFALCAFVLQDGQDEVIYQNTTPCPQSYRDITAVRRQFAAHAPVAWQNDAPFHLFGTTGHMRRVLALRGADPCHLDESMRALICDDPADSAALFDPDAFGVVLHDHSIRLAHKDLQHLFPDGSTEQETTDQKGNSDER